MNLAKPAYDSVLKIDERLILLQNELKELEEQYGFSENYNAETIKPSKKSSKKENSIKVQSKVKFDIPASSGSSKGTEKPSSSQNKQQGKSDNPPHTKTRYNNLTSLNVNEATIPKKFVKPEISQKWIEIFKKKPTRMQFFDPDVHCPKFIDEEDFSRSISMVSDHSNFREYMSDHSIKTLKYIR